MTITSAEIAQLRKGAKEAHNVNIHRLAGLLDAVADIAQDIHDGIPVEVIAISLDNLVDWAAKVARDLCRNVASGNADAAE